MESGSIAIYFAFSGDIFQVILRIPSYSPPSLFDLHGLACTI